MRALMRRLGQINPIAWVAVVGVGFVSVAIPLAWHAHVSAWILLALIGNAVFGLVLAALMAGQPLHYFEGESPQVDEHDQCGQAG